MGVVSSKSPLERRNTVLRRSQRKSIYGVKSKTDKLIKDIKKFKGTEENTDYIELKARIESLERDLRQHSKNLQPQIRHVYSETLKRTEECHQHLSDKLVENQTKHAEKEAAAAAKDGKKEESVVSKDPGESDYDDVFIEEVNEEQQSETLPEKKQTVELKLIQVEQIQESPQFNKRQSLMKIGVPVMPGSVMAALHKKMESNPGSEDKVAEIRDDIEKLEDEISQFVGKKHGKYYNKIKEQLNRYSSDLITIHTRDEAIVEQIKLCHNYIASCLSFLDEKAVEDNGNDDEDDGYDIDNDQNKLPQVIQVVNSNLSPRNMRTTYI